LAVVLLSLLPVLAAAPMPVPISSETAFDAVLQQVDPLTGASAKVVLVDVRTRAEFFWIGAPSKVEKVVLKTGAVLTPDLGKLRVVWDGSYLYGTEQGRHIFISTDAIESLSLAPIAINIPYKVWDEDTATLHPNGTNYENFKLAIEALAKEEGVDIIILFCRSGGRSQDGLAYFDVDLFREVYEIDQPDGKSGRGGLEGTSYHNHYLGYRGFPSRATFLQSHESVSWKDLGLPIKIGVSPFRK